MRTSIQSLLICTVVSFIMSIEPTAARQILPAISARPTVAVLMPEQKGDRDQILPLTKNVLQLFNYIEESAHIKIDIRRYPWRRVLHNGENGEGLIFGIYKTPERLKIFHFSEPVYSDKVWLVKRCDDNFNFQSMEDLKGKTIGIVQGSSAGDEFDKLVNILFKAEYNTSSLAGRFSKLYQKRMDAFLLYEPRTNLKEVQKELNQLYAAEFDEYKKKKVDIFCIVPRPVSVIDAHFATGLSYDKNILEKIDKALIQAKKNGELERIFAK
ncbi:substrate-binding periplasmic protein [Undibacterium sp. Ji22W]|uniref:substrate-binding periplasmic protein n=1 Tax=Undibacterium sp. Ji22W TaxID=3413038 RepID=UPI003BF16BC0